MTKIINTFVYPIVRRDGVLKSITSLRRWTPRNFRVIVVDQTRPNEKFERELRKACDLWIKTKLNFGFAQAVNMGTRIASTKYVTAINDDTLFFTDWWPGIIESFGQYDTAVCVNPMSPKEPGWGYGEPGFRMHATLEECLEQPEETAARLIKERKRQMIDGLACWCSVFKREIMDTEVGWFDERFVPGGGEDYDLMARIYQKGYRAIATSLSWVWHHWGQSKDRRDGLDVALPLARPRWNKLSVKCDTEEGLYSPDIDIWGKNCERVHPEVARFPL